MTREFRLIRTVDVSGVSGLGHIASGWQLDNGWIVLAWPTPIPSVAVFPDEDTMLAAHGHSGNTTVEWTPQTVLGKVGELIAAGLPFTRVTQVGFGPERWVTVETSGRGEWLAWLHALSVAEHPEDAAVQVDWDGTYDFQHRWMDATGNVLVTYLSKGDS